MIGESGSGKSTLAKIIAGLRTANSGTIELSGKLLSGTAERRSTDEKRALQMVFQSPDMTLNPRHRIRRILAGPLRRTGGLSVKGADAKIEQLLQDVGLDADYADRFPGQLSGGQRQRIAIARAFATNPRLIVLDEPTSALDVSVQARILALLNTLQSKDGTAYLFISHDLQVIRNMADRVGVLLAAMHLPVALADYAVKAGE